MGKLTKEEIILLFLENPSKLAYEIWDKNVPKSDEIRTLICDLGNPECAYLYALCVDKSPHTETRKKILNSCWLAFSYARNIDKKPRKDTWKAVQSSIHCRDEYKDAFLYIGEGYFEEEIK